jgi:hypothetical protein
MGSFDGKIDYKNPQTPETKVCRRRYFLYSLIATPFLVGLGLCLAGGGDGIYWPSILITPFAMLMANICNQSSEVMGPNAMLVFFMALAFQFPIYGALMQWADGKKRLKWAVWPIVLIHLAVAITCFAIAGDKWK